MSRLIQLSNALSGIIGFAKPGEMFEKYGAYSPWMDQDASRLRKAVTKRKIPVGAVMHGGVPHIQHVDDQGMKSLRPAKANELIDVAGYKGAKHRLLIETAKPDLERKIKEASDAAKARGSGHEQAIKTVKREHLAGIRKQMKQAPSETLKEISNIRGSLAKDLGTTHRIMGGIRDEAERRGIPRPIGIPGSSGGHGIDRPLMIGESLPEAVHEAKGKLKTIVEANVTHRAKRAGQLEGALRKRISTGIQSVRTGEGRAPHPQSILNSKTHEAMEPFMRKVPPDRSEFRNIAGYMAKPGKRIGLKQIQKKRSLLDSLREGTGTATHQTKVENQAIKSGRVFIDESSAPLRQAASPKSFPTLRKIKIGAGVALAGAAAATLIATRSKKKKAKEVQFARGDIYTAVKTTLIGGTKLINLPKKAKQLVSLRIAAAKGDAAGFRARGRELGMRKMQVVAHRMQTERDKAAAELRGLRIGAKGVRSIGTRLETANAEIDRLTKKVHSRGARIAKLRGETVSPGDAFKAGETHGRTIGAQEEALKNIGARDRFDKEINRVAAAKDTAHAAAMKETVGKIKGAQRKKIAIATGAGVGVGGVAGYEAGKDRRKKQVSMGAKIDTIELDVDLPKRVRRKIEGKPEASITAHAVTGGLEGAAGIYATDPLLEYLRHGRKGIRNPLRDTFRGHVNKISTGAVIGALATAPIGWLVEKEREKRRSRRPIISMSSTPWAGINRELHDSRLYSNLRGAATLENREERKAAHDKLGKPFKKEKIRTAIKVGVTRKPVNAKPIELAVQSGNRTAVTRDRYGKKIYADDKTKAENNYVRTAIGGAAVSSLLRKTSGLSLRSAALAGAAAGVGVQAIVRNRTAKTKDQFGDRSFAGKRIDNVPGQVGGLAVAGIVGKRLINQIRKAKKAGRVVGFHSHGAILSFERKSKWDPNAKGFNRVRRSEEGALYITRATRAVKDLKSVVTGKPALDARGRPKTPEWKKGYVKTAITAGILGATFAGVKGARKFVHEAAARDLASGHTPGGIAKLSEVIKSGALRRAAENKIPGVKKVSGFLGKAKAEVHSAASDPLGKFADRIQRAAEAGPRPIKVAPSVTKTSATGAVTHIPAGSEAARIAERKAKQAARKKLGRIIKEGGELSSKVKSIELAVQVNDWDVRDPRGRSARVYAPGSQRRTRRPKHWYEKSDNQRLIHQGELGGALIAGTLLAGTRRKISTDADSVVSTVEKVIPKHSALEKILHEARTRRLSAQLDNLIAA